MILKNLAIRDPSIDCDIKTCDFHQNKIYKDLDSFNDM